MSAAGSPAPRRRELTLDEYEAGVRGGKMAVLARALTLVESSLPRHQLLAEQLLTRLLPWTERAMRVGISGAPGAGKSTFIEALGLHLVQSGRRVAVLAVDPSSGVSGGSILGDKTRMTALSASPAAYIRPSPSAGTLGGVARKTRECMLVCAAAGYDVVLIETVGVGQSETMVADMTDCFLALMLPGAGDELQGIKRGLLELVDIVAVNKADGDNRLAAKLAATQYRTALESLAGRSRDQAPVVLTCSALHNQGVAEIWQVIERRQEALVERGELWQRRRRQELRWLWGQVEERLRQAVHTHPAVQAIQAALEQDVLAGRLPPEAAARRILEAFFGATVEPSRGESS
ncbi:MAG: methylmalonyl Co-A mutase-associated GTPase MeaB [Pirellulaceae bacterium]|nr:methylmalonyl Co-A mutase-associated GTPase MeaB [Pirellulaceae bacterium]